MPSSSQHPQKQSPRCLSHPFQTRKPKVFKSFSLSTHGTKIDQKGSQNHTRSSQVESKMAILPLAWLILELMLAHLGALVRHLGAVMASSSKQNAIFEPTSSKTAPKMPQPPLPSTPKLPKTKENLKFFNVFHSPAMVPKSTKNAPRNIPRSSQVDSKMAILPLSWLILKVSWLILVATCRQLCPSFANLRPQLR